MLALIAAAAMIAGAVVVRGKLETGSLSSPGAAKDPATLICIPELKPVCDELKDDRVTVVVEHAGATVDRLAGNETVDADAWLTLAPWPDIARDLRQREARGSLPTGGSESIARSPLVMVVSQERGARLDAACGTGTTWRCIGGFSGVVWRDLEGQQAWGRLRPGIDDPAENATGLLVLGHAASDFFRTTSFSTADMDKPGFQNWLMQLSEGMGKRRTPTSLRDQITYGSGAFDVVGTTEAEAVPGAERATPPGGRLEVRYADPPAVADVVLAPLRDGDGSERLAELFQDDGRSALARAGWRVEGLDGEEVPSEPALPQDSNLPGGGALQALRTRWEEVTR